MLWKGKSYVAGRLIAEIITNVYLYQLLAVRGVGNDAEIENNSDIK